METTFTESVYRNLMEVVEVVEVYAVNEYQFDRGVKHIGSVINQRVLRPEQNPNRCDFKYYFFALGVEGECDSLERAVYEVKRASGLMEGN